MLTLYFQEPDVQHALAKRPHICGSAGSTLSPTELTNSRFSTTPYPLHNIDTASPLQTRRTKIKTNTPAPQTQKQAFFFLVPEKQLTLYTWDPADHATATPELINFRSDITFILLEPKSDITSINPNSTLSEPNTHPNQP